MSKMRENNPSVKTRKNSPLTWYVSRNRVAQDNEGGCGGFNFSVKTDSVTHDSKLSLEKWCLAFFQFATNIKGISSCKLASDLGISQPSAWHLGNRVRQSLHGTCSKFKGPVEVDKTYIGNATENKHKYKREHIVGGPKGKAVIAGIMDREANQIDVTHLPDYRGNTIKPFIIDNTIPDANIYSDGSIICSGLRGMAQPPTSIHD